MRSPFPTPGIRSTMCLKSQAAVKYSLGQDSGRNAKSTVSHCGDKPWDSFRSNDFTSEAEKRSFHQDVRHGIGIIAHCNHSLSNCLPKHGNSFEKQPALSKRLRMSIKEYAAILEYWLFAVSRFHTVSIFLIIFVYKHVQEYNHM